jgi:hypothetical protein
VLMDWTPAKAIEAMDRERRDFHRFHQRAGRLVWR